MLTTLQNVPQVTFKDLFNLHERQQITTCADYFTKCPTSYDQGPFQLLIHELGIQLRIVISLFFSSPGCIVFLSGYVFHSSFELTKCPVCNVPTLSGFSQPRKWNLKLCFINVHGKICLSGSIAFTWLWQTLKIYLSKGKLKSALHFYWLENNYKLHFLSDPMHLLWVSIVL